MSDSVGILAYGSLIGNPGSEIEKATRKVVSGVKTPFRVEFARSSRGRGGAPTLVPVENGGCEVSATIFVVDLPVEAAGSCLYRREINKVGSGLAYEEPKKINPDKVVVRRLADFAGIGTVLYTEIAANITPLTAERLAELAVASARTQGGGRDGITYLRDARANGIETPLTADYAAEIMRRLDVANLPDRHPCRKDCPERPPGRDVCVTVVS